MACFIVPATEAVITTAAKKIIKKKDHPADESTIKFSSRLDRLNGLLWGGSGLLAFEHVWHGEVVPFFPFLTNALDPTDRAEMLFEMGTSGVAMAAVVTAVWAVSVLFERKISKRSFKLEAEKI